LTASPAFSTAQLRAELAKRCQHKTQQALARELGVSVSYLSQVIRGRKAPGRKVLEALGLRREANYVHTP
jgi:transcriptional regulator with XRE-family HTH domain